MEVSLFANSMTLSLSHQSFMFICVDALAKPQEYILEGGENVTTEISVYKGPGKTLRFDPIILFLRSSCMSDEHDPVEASAAADAWNQEINGVQSIVFTPPCPAIRWAGSLAESQQFVFASNTLNEIDSLVGVTIFNEVCIRKYFFVSVYFQFTLFIELLK